MSGEIEVHVYYRVDSVHNNVTPSGHDKNATPKALQQTESKSYIVVRPLNRFKGICREGFSKSLMNKSIYRILIALNVHADSLGYFGCLYLLWIF